MENIKQAYQAFAGCPPKEMIQLSPSGSNRVYWRIVAPEGVSPSSVIGVEGKDKDENRAFMSLCKVFHAGGLPVPQLLFESPDGMSYLQEDLGSLGLFDLLAPARESGTYGPEEREILKRTIALLPAFQHARGIDFSVCFPESSFSPRTVDFDLNYFKYCFLKPSGLEFNEARLQDDFDRLREALLPSEESDTFMYRDFQARNVMVRDGQPYMIDFQGGRRGPVHYDLASFVWQARARYPEDLKEELISTYVKALRAYEPVCEADFRARLDLFVLFRTLQVLGAYGFRGLFEGKPHFIKSIPPAMDNVRTLLAGGVLAPYPVLQDVLRRLSELPRFAPQTASEPSAPQAEPSPLTIEVFSFSYKKGFPEDRSGNGGGFVFDCRGMHNPGRYDEYKQLTGMDKPVIDFLEQKGEVQDFLKSAYSMVDHHVDCFLARAFDHLSVSFGCTGGRHRSAYCAEHMAAHLKKKYPQAKVFLSHEALNIKKEIL